MRRYMRKRRRKQAKADPAAEQMMELQEEQSPQQSPKLFTDFGDKHSPEAILHLQSLVGNRAVQRLLDENATEAGADVQETQAGVELEALKDELSNQLEMKHRADYRRTGDEASILLTGSSGDLMDDDDRNAALAAEVREAAGGLALELDAAAGAGLAWDGLVEVALENAGLRFEAELKQDEWSIALHYTDQPPPLEQMLQFVQQAELLLRRILATVQYFPLGLHALQKPLEEDMKLMRKLFEAIGLSEEAPKAQLNLAMRLAQIEGTDLPSGGASFTINL